MRKTLSKHSETLSEYRGKTLSFFLYCIFYYRSQVTGWKAETTAS